MQDVFGGIQVGVENHVAGFAPEYGALPLPLLDASTYGASLGGISCWNKLNSNTSFFPFVFEERLKLEKSPVGEEPVLLMPVPCSSDSLEVCAAARIIVDSSSRKLWSWSFSLDGSLHGRAGIFVGNNRKLRGKTKAFSENGVVEMVHPECIDFFVVIAGGNDKILGIRHEQKVFIKDSSLFWKFLNNSLYRFHHIPIRLEKAYKSIRAKNAYGKNNIIGEIQHQLSQRLVSKIQKGNPNWRTDRISQFGSAQRGKRERLGNLRVENYAGPHSSFPISTAKVCANRHRTTAKGQKFKRDVSTISTSENDSQERQTVVSKLLCWNRRTRFGRNNTKIHSRAGEGSQFLLWLKPVVSLRGAL